VVMSVASSHTRSAGALTSIETQTPRPSNGLAR
jgi:hypothetical protein